MRFFTKIFKITLLSMVIVVLSSGGLYAQKDSESVDINLYVSEYVSLELPQSMEMDVTVNENKSMGAEVSFNTNCPVNISIESSGFNGNDDHLLNDYVLYEIEGLSGSISPSFSYAPITVRPGTEYSGIFKVSWLGEEFFNETEWQTVPTGTYQDTITITISY